MKYFLTILFALLLFAGCSTVPKEEMIVAEDAVDETVPATSTDSEESVHAQNSYFIIDDQAVIDKLDTAEYKMLINLDDYEPAVLWDLMKTAAEENGIDIEESDEPLKPRYRDVQYIDSDYGMLNNMGYILRHRFKYDNFVEAGSPDNEMDSKYDITIKFRDSDLDKSLASTLSVGSAFEDIAKKPEMEADISPYGIKYSHSIKVKPKVKDYGLFVDLFEPVLSSYAALYPDLLDIGLDADIEVRPVGGLTVLEEKIEPAVFTLDCGAEMEVAFSVFFIEGEPLVAEVSYDFDLEYDVKDSDGNEEEKKMALEDFDQVEAFYRSLLNSYDEKLNFGWSKTNFVFDSLPSVD